MNEVHRVARGALNYCLLLDSRSSQHEHFKLQQYEATQLLSQVVQAGKDSGILVAFDDHFHLDAEGTSPQEFVNAIARVKPHSRSDFDDAVIWSAYRMLQGAPDSGVRLLFILSDGDGINQHMRPEAVGSALLKAGIRVYVVGQKFHPSNSIADPWWNSAVEADRDEHDLTRLAEKTGGKAYFPTSEKNVGKAVADLADELASLFAVTYTPPHLKPDGPFPHKLEVRCNKKNVSITAPDRVAD